MIHVSVQSLTFCRVAWKLAQRQDDRRGLGWAGERDVRNFRRRRLCRPLGDARRAADDGAGGPASRTFERRRRTGKESEDRVRVAETRFIAQRRNSSSRAATSGGGFEDRFRSQRSSKDAADQDGGKGIGETPVDYFASRLLSSFKPQCLSSLAFWAVWTLVDKH